MELLDQQLSRGAIEAAASRIRAFVRRTPVLVADGAELALPGIRLAFKLEFTQYSGSFKARGAFNSLLSRALGPAFGSPFDPAFEDGLERFVRSIFAVKGEIVAEHDEAIRAATQQSHQVG